MFGRGWLRRMRWRWLGKRLPEWAADCPPQEREYGRFLSASLLRQRPSADGEVARAMPWEIRPEVRSLPEVIDLHRPRCSILAGLAAGATWSTGDEPPPQGDLLVRQLIVQQAEAVGLAGFPAENVLVTSGAADAFAAVLAACLDRQDSIVLFDPCSPLFAAAARRQGCRVIYVPSWTEDGYRRFLKRDLERAIRRGKLLAIDEPANPTQAVLHPEDAAYLAWLATAHDVLLFVDYSLHPFVDRPLRETLAAWEPAGRRLLASCSLSWPYGLTGWRVGWLLGPRLLLRAVEQVRSGNVSIVAQQAAATVLQTDTTAVYRWLRRRLQWRRQWAGTQLQSLGLEGEPSPQGCFLWVSTAKTGRRGREWAEHLGHTQRVLVTPGERFGPSGDKMVRINLLADETRLYEGLRRIRAAMRGTAANGAAASASSASSPPGAAATSDRRMAPAGMDGV